MNNQSTLSTLAAVALALSEMPAGKGTPHDPALVPKALPMTTGHRTRTAGPRQPAGTKIRRQMAARQFGIPYKGRL